jgi:hypothetical protein
MMAAWAILMTVTIAVAVPTLAVEIGYTNLQTDTNKFSARTKLRTIKIEQERHERLTA